MKFSHWAFALIAFLLIQFPAFAAEEAAKNPTSVEKLTDFAIEKMNSAFDTIQKAAPVVTDAVLWVVRVNLLQAIAVSLLLLLISIITFFIWKKFALPPLKEMAKDRFDASFARSLMVILLIPSIVLALIGVVRLANVWLWVGLWHPELYLIYETWEKVMN